MYDVLDPNSKSAFYKSKNDQVSNMDLLPEEIFWENNQIRKELSKYDSLVQSLGGIIEDLYSKLSDIVYLENTLNTWYPTAIDKSDYCELANQIDSINWILSVNVWRLNELLNSIKL